MTCEKAFARLPLLAAPTKPLQWQPNLVAQLVDDEELEDGRKCTEGMSEVGIAAAEAPCSYTRVTV
jgi:hypothetical protein